MRRSLILTTVLAASAAVLGACDNKPQEPVKPASTPVPVASSSPVPSPTTSPSGTPAKPGSSPEVKKPDGKPVNNDAKPPVTQTTPKGK